MAKFKQNVPTYYNNNIERLAWYNHEISQQFLQALPNHEGIMSNRVFMEAVQNYLGLPSFILKGFADGNHFIGRNKAMVDLYGIAVKNAMLIQGDYIQMHGLIQTLAMDMLKKNKSMGNTRASTYVPWPRLEGIYSSLLRAAKND